MPTTSHGRKLRKGAIVANNLQTSKQTAIVFQYNPEKPTRTIQPGQMEPSGAERQRAMALRYKGAPEETSDLDIAIDATDPHWRVGRGMGKRESTGKIVRSAKLPLALVVDAFDMVGVCGCASEVTSM